MNQVREVCEVMRRALEPGLRGFECGKVDSSGACLYAAFLLQQTLEKFAGCSVEIRGGDGAGDGGLRGLDGAWHGHYWAEVELQNGSRIVADITADQFGYEPVVVVPIGEASAQYVAGHQGTVDEAVAEIVEEFLPNNN